MKGANVVILGFLGCTLALPTPIMDEDISNIMDNGSSGEYSESRDLPFSFTPGDQNHPSSGESQGASDSAGVPSPMAFSNPQLTGSGTSEDSGEPGSVLPSLMSGGQNPSGSGETTESGAMPPMASSNPIFGSGDATSSKPNINSGEAVGPMASGSPKPPVVTPGIGASGSNSQSSSGAMPIPSNSPSGRPVSGDHSGTGATHADTVDGNNKSPLSDTQRDLSDALENLEPNGPDWFNTAVFALKNLKETPELLNTMHTATIPGSDHIFRPDTHPRPPSSNQPLPEIPSVAPKTTGQYILEWLESTVNNIIPKPIQDGWRSRNNNLARLAKIAREDKGIRGFNAWMAMRGGFAGTVATNRGGGKWIEL